MGVAMTWLDDIVNCAHARVDERVLDELAARGVSETQVSRFRLGQLYGLPDNLDLPKDFIEWSHYGRRLDDVFVLPLTTTLGAVRGLQFRHVDRDRSGYMDYIVDKAEAVLFGLGEAMPHVWETGSIWLVEGGFDLFPIQKHFPGVVATLTARVVDPLISVMRRTVTDVWMGYDMDERGQRSNKSFARSHGEVFKVHQVSYPQPLTPSGKKVKDPGDLWETWGDDRVGVFVRATIDAG
jgi:DNA primase